MSILDDLRAVGAIERDAVTIGGKTFHVQSLNAGQRQVLTRAATKDGDIPDYLVAALGLIDENGHPLAPVDEIEEFAKQLVELKGTAVSKIAAKVYQVSALNKEALEDAEKK